MGLAVVALAATGVGLVGSDSLTFGNVYAKRVTCMPSAQGPYRAHVTALISGCRGGRACPPMAGDWAPRVRTR